MGSYGENKICKHQTSETSLERAHITLFNSYVNYSYAFQNMIQNLGSYHSHIDVDLRKTRQVNQRHGFSWVCFLYQF